jgi:hypothetical protein
MGVAATVRGVYYPSEHPSMVEARAAEFNCRICTAAHESAVGTNRVTPKIFLLMFLLSWLSPRLHHKANSPPAILLRRAAARWRQRRALWPAAPPASGRV